MKTLFPQSGGLRKKLQGMTLVEMMVAVGLGGILLAVVAVLTVNSARSILAMTNYTELDRSSRNALDTLTRDVRQGKDLVNYSSNSITMTTLSGVTFSYHYDPTARTLTRIWDGDSKVLLANCDALTFRISQRNPSNNFTFYPAASLATAKLVDVDWKCSREIKGQKVNTESIQTAKIVLRN